MAKWLLKTGWPFNTGLTVLRVYQQDKDGNKAKYPWYSDKSITVQFSIVHTQNSSRDSQATGSSKNIGEKKEKETIRCYNENVTAAAW